LHKQHPAAQEVAHDDSPVALSDNAATHPGNLRPAMAKSLPVFTFLP